MHGSLDHADAWGLRLFATLKPWVVIANISLHHITSSHISYALPVSCTTHQRGQKQRASKFELNQPVAWQSFGVLYIVSHWGSFTAICSTLCKVAFAFWTAGTGLMGSVAPSFEHKAKSEIFQVLSLHNHVPWPLEIWGQPRDQRRVATSQEAHRRIWLARATPSHAIWEGPGGREGTLPQMSILTILTYYDNISLQHIVTAYRYSISLQHIVTAYRYNISLQHIVTTYRHNISLQHIVRAL